MSVIEKGTPLHRLNLAAGSAGLTAEVFAGDVADACNMVASPNAFITDLKTKTAVRAGERLTMPTAELRRLVDAAQNPAGHPATSDATVSKAEKPHPVNVPPERVAPIHDVEQPTTTHRAVVETPEPQPPGTLRNQMLQKNK